MIAIVDYGVGNLFSLSSSLCAIGAQTVVTGDPDRILCADHIVLPGVGAFGDAAAKLRQTGLDQVILQAAKQGKPLLGICLGMQLLFERSYEYGVHTGLGLIPGEVVPMQGKIPSGLCIPHIGWNALHLKPDANGLFRYLRDGEYVYFVHSYFAQNCAPYVTAETEYGITMTAAAACGRVYGCQFHPEKSGETGLRILRAFCEI